MASETNEFRKSLIEDGKGGGDTKESGEKTDAPTIEKLDMKEVGEELERKSLINESDVSETKFVKDPSITSKGEEVRVEVDGFYGWVVVVASFLCCFVVGVMFIAFSILYLEFADYFEAERGVTGWVGSLYLATGNLCGVVISLIIEYRGCRFLIWLGSIVWTLAFALSFFAVSIPYLYLSYGVLGGIGFNMVTMSSFVIVQKHFHKHRSLAAGLSASGISIGSLTSGPLIGYFVSSYGWRGTLLIMSGMALNCCVFGCFYRPPRLIRTVTVTVGSETTSKKQMVLPKKDEQVTKAPVSKHMMKILKGLTDVSLFRNPRFTAACMSTLFFNVGASIFYQHTPSRAIAFGIERSSAYFIQTIVGILTLVARIIGAWVGNTKWTDRILQYGLSVMSGGVCLLSTGLSDIYVTICLVAACTGFCSGLTMTIQTTVMSDIVGVSRIHTAQAFIFVFMGIGALVGVPLAGFIYDRTGDYNLPFYIGGSVELFGGFVMVITHTICKLNSKQDAAKDSLNV